MTTRSDDIRLPRTIKLVRLDNKGSMYLYERNCERLWLPIVGPSVWVLAQRTLDFKVGEDVVVGRDDFAHSLGLSPRRLEAVVTRMIRFNWATWTQPTRQLFVISRVDTPAKQPMRRTYPEQREIGEIIG